MKRFVTLLMAMLSAVSPCWAGITYHGTSAQALYVRVQTGESTFKSVALSEGTSGGLGVYHIEDTALELAGVDTAGTFPYTIRANATPSDTANDPIVGDGVLYWSGTAELPAAADVTTWLGTAVATPTVAGVPEVDMTHAAGSTTPVGNIDIVFNGDFAANYDAANGNWVTKLDPAQGPVAFTGHVSISDGLAINASTVGRDGLTITGNQNGVSIVGGAGYGVHVSTPGATAALIETSDPSSVGVSIVGGFGLEQMPGIRSTGIDSDITGNLSGSAGSVTAGVTLADDAITAGKIANDAIGSDELATTAVDEIQANLAGNGVKLTTTGLADVNAEVDTALADYGALKPTTAGRTLDVAATGEAAADAVLWAGAATATDDVALKSSLAKGTDLTGFNDPTADGIANSVLDELLDDHTTPGSLSAVVTDIFDFLDGAPTFSSAMDGQGYTMALASKLDTNVDAKISEVPGKTPSLLVSSTIDDTTVAVTQTSFALAAGPPDDDALNGAIVIITRGTQKAVGLVKDYEKLTKTVTLVADPGIFTFANEDQVDVIATGAAIPLWLSGQ